MNRIKSLTQNFTFMNKQFLQNHLRSTLLPFLSMLPLFLASSNLYAADTPMDAPAAQQEAPKAAAKLMAKPIPASAMQAGRDAVAAKDWDKAIAQFKLASVQEPKNADAYNMLAYSYRKQAKPDLAKAFENYNLALKLDPKHKGAHEYIGEAYLMDKKPADAEKHLTLLASICGNKTCEEYTDLAKAIADYKK
jgi:Flp pilus assembly protein TadD